MGTPWKAISRGTYDADAFHAPRGVGRLSCQQGVCRSWQSAAKRGMWSKSIIANCLKVGESRPALPGRERESEPIWHNARVDPVQVMRA